MNILNDTFRITPDRHPDIHIAHPWCDGRRCVVEVLEDALRVTHRLDVTGSYEPVSDAFTLDGHTRVDMVHEQLIGFASRRVEVDHVRVDVLGAPENQLSSCQYVARLYARIAAERAVKALTGVELSPTRAVAEQAVAAFRAGAR